VLTQTLGFPGGALYEGYSYNANRLKSGGEYNSLLNAQNAQAQGCPDAASRWCQGFSYDPWGNRAVSASLTTNLTPSILSPMAFDPNTNRNSGANWNYDTAGLGNLTGDPALHSFTYDSEGNMLSVCTAGSCTQYAYDANGRRVKRTNADLTTDLFVYDAAGELAAESIDAGFDSGTNVSDVGSFGIDAGYFRAGTGCAGASGLYGTR
jgi:YD repeat-containing protein